MEFNFKRELARSSQPSFCRLPILFLAAVLGLQGCNGVAFTNAPYVAGVSFSDRSQDNSGGRRFDITVNEISAE